MTVGLIQPPDVFQTARVGNKIGPGRVRRFTMQERSHAYDAFVSYFKTKQPPRHGANSPVPRFHVIKVLGLKPPQKNIADSRVAITIAQHGSRLCEWCLYGIWWNQPSHSGVDVRWKYIADRP